MADFNFLLENRLSQDQQLALRAVEQLCHGARRNVYLTGGPMRDLLIGRPVRLLEITTEGDPSGLQPGLLAAGAERLSVQAAQRSLHLRLHGSRLRISAARAVAGGNEMGTIIEDLRRRGLTVNSIGLSLNAASRGLPLDPTNGAADIEARLIRGNHPHVFFDDPIVIIRAVRLRARLEFEWEERTLARLQSAREAKVMDRATAAARGQEWEAIAYEPDPAQVLRLLDKEGWLEAAFGGGVHAGKMNLGGLARLSEVVEAWEQLGLSVDAGLVAMPLMLGGLAPSDQNRLAQWLPSRHLAGWKKLAGEARGFEKRLLALAGTSRGLERLQELIEKAPAEAVALTSLDPQDAKAGRKLKEFQAAAHQIRQRLPLGVLRSLGVAPHSLAAEEMLRPFFRRLLSGESIEDATLAEQIRSQAQRLAAPAATMDSVKPGKRTVMGRPVDNPRGGKPEAGTREPGAGKQKVTQSRVSGPDRAPRGTRLTGRKAVPHAKSGPSQAGKK